MRILQSIVCSAVLALCLSGTGCQRSKDVPPSKVTVDAVAQFPVIKILETGTLRYQDKAITPEELAAFVADRVERDIREGPEVDYRTIIIEPHPAVPYAAVQEVKRLILKSGGRPGELRMDADAPSVSEAAEPMK
jgi:biopolymer transport protein ExbD